MRFFAPQGRHVAPMGVKFGMEEGTFGPLLHAKFHPHRCNVSPLRGEKPQNRPLSKLNTGRFALRAMLPVIIDALACQAALGVSDFVMLMLRLQKTGARDKN